MSQTLGGITGNPGGWNHYVLTYNDPTSNYTAYLNGVPVAWVAYVYSSSWSTTARPSTTLVGGQGGHNSLPGYFYNVIGWAQTRTPSQVLYDYVCSGLAGPQCLGCIVLNSTAWTCS